MNTLIKISTDILQIAAIAFLLFCAGMLCININNTNAELSKTILELNTTITFLNEEMDDNFNSYSETIKEIVETVQITDSYLFVGGFNNEEADAFNLKKMEDMLTMSSNFSDLLNNTENYFNERENYVSETPNIWPMKYSNKIRVSSPFGDRYSPFTGKMQPHTGIDIVSVVGEEILATADGIVKDNYIMDAIFGRWLVIEHANLIETHYAHLSKVFVHEGYVVKKGDVIGIIGNSGLSTGLHLHYGVKKDGVFIDPIDFIQKSANKNLTIKE